MPSCTSYTEPTHTWTCLINWRTYILSVYLSSLLKGNQHNTYWWGLITALRSFNELISNIKALNEQKSADRNDLTAFRLIFSHQNQFRVKREIFTCSLQKLCSSSFAVSQPLMFCSKLLKLPPYIKKPNSTPTHIDHVIYSKSCICQQVCLLSLSVCVSACVSVWELVYL